VLDVFGSGDELRLLRHVNDQELSLIADMTDGGLLLGVALLREEKVATTDEFRHPWLHVFHGDIPRRLDGHAAALGVNLHLGLPAARVEVAARRDGVVRAAVGERVVDRRLVRRWPVVTVREVHHRSHLCALRKTTYFILLMPW